MGEAAFTNLVFIESILRDDRGSWIFLLLIFITVCLLTAPDKFDGTLIIMIVPSMIAIIAIPENTVINPTHQSVKSCIRYLCPVSNYYKHEMEYV